MDFISYGRCPICGEYAFLDGHKCAPTWCVNLAEKGPHYCEDTPPWEIRAHDAQDAAQTFAELWDSNAAEYMIVGGEEVTVVAWPKGDPGKKRTLLVRGELVPEYWAEEVTDAKD